MSSAGVAVVLSLEAFEGMLPFIFQPVALLSQPYDIACLYGMCP